MIELFWLSIFVVVWQWLGYGIFIGELSTIRKMRSTVTCPQNGKFYPDISVIIAAFNEEDVIAKRIQNCLEMNYPEEKVEIIVGSDGSTDKTVEIARGYSRNGVITLDLGANRGRAAVHNDCAQIATGTILFFTDAETVYDRDCIQMMVQHYANPEVGCVGGELVSSSFKRSAVGGIQGVYWKWEYALRRWQSDLRVLTKASGANMSIRKELFRPVPQDVDIDQVGGPFTILQGYHVIHEPNAIAYEKFPHTPEGEIKQRKRFAIRALTSLRYYPELINPFIHPWIAFNLISYRILRYFVPFFLVIAFFSNAAILHKSPLYLLTFSLQTIFYLTAALGYIFMKFGMGRKLKVLSLPFAFLWFNLGVAWGTIEFLMGNRITSYQPINNVKSRSDSG